MTDLIAKTIADSVAEHALRAAPVHWGSAQKGMVPGDEIDDEKADCFR